MSIPAQAASRYAPVVAVLLSGIPGPLPVNGRTTGRSHVPRSVRRMAARSAVTVGANTAEHAGRSSSSPCQVGGQVVEDADDIASLMMMWDTLKSEALPRSASLDLMEKAAKTWT